MPLRFFPHPLPAQELDQLDLRNMILRTDAHGVSCFVRDPVKKRFSGVSGQGGGLQDEDRSSGISMSCLTKNLTYAGLRCTGQSVEFTDDFALPKKAFFRVSRCLLFQ